MQTIYHINDKATSLNYIEVGDAAKMMYAKIDLNLGGSLQELVFNGNTVISSNETLPYEESYASAILFPFANRIENGQYNFNNQSYQLSINKVEENNALHGLVYNKTFTLLAYKAEKDEAIVQLRYNQTEECAGFPFKFCITLTYIFKLDALELIVEIKNLDSFSFPFTVGWHPYFVTSNLHDSFLNLEFSKRILVNKQGIPTKEASVTFPNEMQVKDQEFDDCFILKNPCLGFKTPDYTMGFSFSPDTKYLQLYTPKNKRTIAIEPQTGAANNFNDNRGLKILHPQELYEARWKIKVQANTN